MTIVPISSTTPPTAPPPQPKPKPQKRSKHGEF